MKIQLLRHGSYLIYYNNKKILVDPVFAAKNTLRAIDSLINTAKNPLVDLSVDLNDVITDLDYLIITHLHYDHFDDDAKALLPKDITLFCQSEDIELLQEDGFTKTYEVIDTIANSNFKISRVIAQHGYNQTAEEMGPASGFILSYPNFPTVYLTGDTVYDSIVDENITKHKSDLIIANGGGAKFIDSENITMSIEEIVRLAQNYPDKKIIVVHMDAWNHASYSRSELFVALQENQLNNVKVLDDGEVGEY